MIRYCRRRHPSAAVLFLRMTAGPVDSTKKPGRRQDGNCVAKAARPFYFTEEFPDCPRRGCGSLRRFITGSLFSRQIYAIVNREPSGSIQTSPIPEKISGCSCEQARQHSNRSEIFHFPPVYSGITGRPKPERFIGLCTRLPRKYMSDRDRIDRRRRPGMPCLSSMAADWDES